MNDVLHEFTLVLLSVGEDQFTMAILSITLEISFVADPFIVELVEVCEVEGTLNLTLLVVVDDPLTIELVLAPLSLVGHRSIGVVQGSETVHFVALPFSIVVTAFLVTELAFAVALPVDHVALIAGACLKGLLHEHTVLEFG